MALIQSLHKSNTMKKIEKVVTQLPTKEKAQAQTVSQENSSILFKNCKHPNDT